MDTVSIDPQSLYSLTGSASAPLVLDVRRAPAFDADDSMIPGALRPTGDPVAFLEGGIGAWRAAGLPTMRRHPEWHVPGRSRWITRARPKIDRIACPWLIQRFIDPLARFDYVPAKDVFDEAAARDAVPYDLPGAVVTHRGERCSFDALLEDFALADPALDRLADDHEMLEHAMPLYDGLYAWCRREVQGLNERHSWTPDR